MRLLLVLFLIHGLVPAFGEAAEAVVHYATTGHLAHSDADGGDLGEQGGEHGCSPTSHLSVPKTRSQPPTSLGTQAGGEVASADEGPEPGAK